MMVGAIGTAFHAATLADSIARFVVSMPIGPDATGAGWVYGYAIVDHHHRYSLADLRSLQDWFLRYQLEALPGVAEVASLGGFVKQYQVRVDPEKLRAYNIPLSTVMDKVRDSTNEVGGRLMELGGAEYMIRGLGYLHSLSDLETVPVASKNGNACPCKRPRLGVVRTRYQAGRGRVERGRRSGRRHRGHAIRPQCTERDRGRGEETRGHFGLAAPPELKSSPAMIAPG